MPFNLDGSWTPAQAPDGTAAPDPAQGGAQPYQVALAQALQPQPPAQGPGVEQNALSGDAMAYGDQGTLPQAASTAASLSSGHAFADYAGLHAPADRGMDLHFTLPGVVAHAADAIHAVGSDPVGAASALGTGMVDSAASGLTLPGDALQGKLGDPRDPAFDRAALARVPDMLGLMAGPGLPMAEEGAAGVMGGRLLQPEALEQRLARNAVPAEGQSVHSVYIHPTDDMWSGQEGFYIPPTGDRTGFKIDRAADFMKGLQDGEPFRAPQLGVGPDSFGFDDGRHRFSAMRDLGMETAPVSMDPQSLAHARSLGLVAEDGPPSLAWGQHAGEAGGGVSLEDQMAALLGRPAGWKPPSKFADMDEALRGFVPPAPGPAMDRQPASKLLDPSADAFNVFHGTAAETNFGRFDPTLQGQNISRHQQGAVFFSPDPQEAGAYAHQGRGEDWDLGHTAGPRVMPATVDPGRSALYDLPALFDAKDPRLMANMREMADQGGGGLGRHFDGAMQREVDQRAARAAAGQPDPGLGIVFNAHNAALKMAREDGMDTAILRGLRESEGADQLGVLTPGRVHSAIDGRLLYSGGVPGVPALAGHSPPTQPDAGDPLHAALMAQASGQAPRAPDPLLEAMMAGRR